MVDVLQLDFVSGRKAVAYWEIRLFCCLILGFKLQSSHVVGADDSIKLY